MKRRNQTRTFVDERERKCQYLLVIAVKAVALITAWLEVLLTAEDTDLILMDVMMPELDGYTTMTRIRQMPAFVTLPIIAVTARAMPGDKEKSIAAGASDYVTKPVDTDELLACMERWLTRR